MKEELTIYRLEHKDTNDSMWYNNKGDYNPFIMTLTEGAAKQLPMELDLKNIEPKVKNGFVALTVKNY